MTPITEFDIVFISLDEPNADNNWLDLKNKCPWAKRSHGVYGSDAAHKAAAALCSTDRFITVDADNIVYEDFFNIQLDMSKIKEDEVISWAGKNEINGLVYGNGGIKCWPKKIVENMKTHEAADPTNKRDQVDFCWNVNYSQMNYVFSKVYNNASPYQAYRAGFREGCKMTLESGRLIDINRIKELHPRNYKRLLIWMSVGEDSINGLWAMYGARLGCEMSTLRREEWDWINVRDFRWHDRFWADEIAPRFEKFDGIMCPNTGYSYSEDILKEEIIRIGQNLRDNMNLEIAELDKQGSKFFKASYTNPARIHPLINEERMIDTVIDKESDII